MLLHKFMNITTKLHARRTSYFCVNKIHILSSRNLDTSKKLVVNKSLCVRLIPQNFIVRLKHKDKKKVPIHKSV